jgi:hypothetical protein
MNKKAFALAGIFLSIALIVPPIALITQSAADIDNIINQAPNLADETQAQGFIEAIQNRHRNIFAIVLMVEVICVALFALLLWIGLTR